MFVLFVLLFLSMYSNEYKYSLCIISLLEWCNNLDIQPLFCSTVFDRIHELSKRVLLSNWRVKDFCYLLSLIPNFYSLIIRDCELKQQQQSKSKKIQTLPLKMSLAFVAKYIPIFVNNPHTKPSLKHVHFSIHILFIYTFANF